MNGLRSHRPHGDEGMTMIELLVTSTVLIVLLGMVLVSVNLMNDVSNNVTSQYDEFDQALPAMAPFHNLLAAEVEPAPTVSGVPTPGFAAIGNFGMTFYSNIGTNYNNTLACPNGVSTCTGSTAGPAKIVVQEVDSTGAIATSCNTKAPCTLKVWMYLPQPNAALGAGAPSCPIQWGAVYVPTAQCSYTDGQANPPAGTFRLLSDVQDVVNDPSAVDGSGAPTDPIFTYSIFDPTYNQNIPLTAAQVQSGTINGLASVATSLTKTDTNYPSDTQSLSTCVAPTASYPTAAIACPRDAIQSVDINLRVAKPGAGASATVNQNLVVYRYAQSPGSSTAPYQYSTSQG